MPRVSILLAVLVALAMGMPAALAQVETPIAPAATPTGPARPDLVGVAPLPLSGERRAAFEAYVAASLEKFGVPGASVAVVQGGQVVYLQGFGVREVGESEPVTPDTLLMIGSVTKGMTSTMAATLVDQGWLSWDEPVADLLPGFALADPATTARVTVADAFCACTGLPRRDAELILNFNALTPERLIADARALPLTAPFGEKFQYNNQMYAIGGYAAAVAGGANPDDLYGAYVALMHDRLLNPVGMDRSTFTLHDVLVSGDYAHPHGTNLAGETLPLPIVSDQGFATAVAPAGALWSTARDMARYIQMELADGVAADGTRVVSAENLARTRAPRVPTPAPPGTPPPLAKALQHYAMGWGVGEWRGLPLVSHTGGTLGFVSEVAFLPDADLGVVILTNGGLGAGQFTMAVQYRLFEILFDQPADYDVLLAQLMPAQTAALDQLRAAVRPVDPAAVAPYLGRYSDPQIGDVVLAMRDGRLVFDAGEIRSGLAAIADESGAAGYVFTDPPLFGPFKLQLRGAQEGDPQIVATIPTDEGGVETHTLSMAAPAAATPAP